MFSATSSVAEIDRGYCIAEDTGTRETIQYACHTHILISVLQAVSRWKKAISAATWAVDQHPMGGKLKPKPNSVKPETKRQRSSLKLTKQGSRSSLKKQKSKTKVVAPAPAAAAEQFPK